MNTILYIVVSVFSVLSFVLTVVGAPLFVFMSVCDLAGNKNDRLPVLFHVTAFFSVFTFAAMLAAYLDGPELPLLVKVPAVIGLLLLWFYAIREAITKRV